MLVCAAIFLASKKTWLKVEKVIASNGNKIHVLLLSERYQGSRLFFPSLDGSDINKSSMVFSDG